LIKNVIFIQFKNFLLFNINPDTLDLLR
jgi:hypothetical protein